MRKGRVGEGTAVGKRQVCTKGAQVQIYRVFIPMYIVYAVLGANSSSSHHVLRIELGTWPIIVSLNH